MPIKPVETYITEDSRILRTVELTTWLTNNVPSSGFSPAVQLTVELPSRARAYVWIEGAAAKQLALIAGRGTVRFAFMSVPGIETLELREILLPDGQVTPCFVEQADVVLRG